MADVFFADANKPQKVSLLDKLELLIEKANFEEFIEVGDLVAIKVHFGEKGNTAFISPIFIRRIVEKVKLAGGKPFLTDTNTLYVGSRADAVEHLKTAIENGFSYATAGAPLVIADGLNGKDYVSVEIKGKHFREAKIGSALYHADSLIVVSHVKGHEMTGFGGALKNIGMGGACRSGKQMIHSDVLPTVDLKLCKGCGKCLKWCPTEAISLVDKKAIIDESLCLGCGECTVTCPYSAIVINWKTEPDIIQEKIVEYAWAVLKDKKGKAGFINFLTNVTPDCDCWSWSDPAIVSDVGILVSKDPVAIDQASVSLINRTPGIETSRLRKATSRDKFRSLYPLVDWDVQLRHGEEIGLGEKRYNLIEVSQGN